MKPAILNLWLTLHKYGGHVTTFSFPQVRQTFEQNVADYSPRDLFITPDLAANLLRFETAARLAKIVRDYLKAAIIKKRFDCHNSIRDVRKKRKIELSKTSENRLEKKHRINCPSQNDNSVRKTNGTSEEGGI